MKAKRHIELTPNSSYKELAEVFLMIHFEMKNLSNKLQDCREELEKNSNLGLKDKEYQEPILKKGNNIVRQIHNSVPPYVFILNEMSHKSNWKLN